MSDVTEMELRVAKALFAADHGMSWDDVALSVREYFTDLARAAIRAMYPLPDDLAEQFKDRFDNDVVYGTDRQVHWLWHDIIRAASPEDNAHGR